MSNVQRNYRSSTASNEQGFIYLIRSSGGLFKIGCTLNVKQRLKDLERRYKPHSLELLHWFPCGSMSAAENMLHGCFEKERVGGEWFKLKEADVRLLLKVVKLKTLPIKVGIGEVVSGKNFVTFAIDDPDKVLRERAKANARRRGTTVSAILRDCFLALVRGEESNQVGPQLVQVTTEHQGEEVVEAQPDSTEGSSQVRARSAKANGNGQVPPSNGICELTYIDDYGERIL